MKIVAISDVSIGYGSPEVPALMHDICRTLGAQGVLVEPDEISRPEIRLTWEPSFTLRRIRCDFPDHTPSWHAVYAAGALKIVEEVRPDILILFGPSVFRMLPALRHRPRKIVYHAYEYISKLPEAEIETHRLFLDSVDLMIAPDVERLILDLENIVTQPRDLAFVYNAADVDFPHQVKHVPAEARNGAYIYYGTLNRRSAYAHYFWADATRDFAFDLFGRITDPEPGLVLSHFIQAPNVTYNGVVSAAELNARRQHAAFSLVWWNPEPNPGFYYVPPNRFFTSIQAHVPPIAAPHPQCVEVIERYGCGVVMEDWSLPSLVKALERTTDMMGTSRYDALVRGCEDAVHAEISWEAQFGRIKPAIQALSRSAPKAASGA